MLGEMLLMYKIYNQKKNEKKKILLAEKTYSSDLYLI